MKIAILGAAGFIGTNLTIMIAQNKENIITLVDQNRVYFFEIEKYDFENVNIIVSPFEESTDFDSILEGHDVVYHLISTTVPTTSNQQIAQELAANVIVTSKILESCVRCKVGKVVFISSGGTVYGKEAICPLKEDTETNPITSYGVQKVTIEKLLYLYRYMYNLDYRVVRLANPYGPYQRPNGILGAVTTFTYKALKNEEILVYGDGSVVRDFIYIEDAVRAIINIAESESKYRTFNLGCGYGCSIRNMLDTVQKVLDKDINVVYQEARSVDVPVNYLDISRYESVFGKLEPISLEEGIKRTSEFLQIHYNIQ